MPNAASVLAGLLLLAACPPAQTDTAAGVVAVEVAMNDRTLTVHADSANATAAAAEFCGAHDLPAASSPCARLVESELHDALYCGHGPRAGGAPRTFRFVHHEHYYESTEFVLLRALARASGFKECAAGPKVSGGEDAVWALGHLDGDPAWLYVGRALPVLLLLLLRPRVCYRCCHAASSSCFRAAYCTTILPYDYSLTPPPTSLTSPLSGTTPSARAGRGLTRFRRPPRWAA